MTMMSFPIQNSKLGFPRSGPGFQDSAPRTYYLGLISSVQWQLCGEVSPVTNQAGNSTKRGHSSLFRHPASQIPPGKWIIPPRCAQTEWGRDIPNPQ